MTTQWLRHLLLHRVELHIPIHHTRSTPGRYPTEQTPLVIGGDGIINNLRVRSNSGMTFENLGGCICPLGGPVVDRGGGDEC